jgi:hypothetical protein
MRNTKCAYTGGYFPKKQNAIYFLTGSWCLAALVLVCAYNSLLTSFILGPNAHALVDSLKDLVLKPDVLLVVDRGYGVDMVLSVINTKGGKSYRKELCNKFVVTFL